MVLSITSTELIPAVNVDPSAAYLSEGVACKPIRASKMCAK